MDLSADPNRTHKRGRIYDFRDLQKVVNTDYRLYRNKVCLTSVTYEGVNALLQK